MSKPVTAQLNYVRNSPRKLRLVADLVRGKRAVRAEEQLSLMNKKAARHLLKLLRSAVANAKHNFSLVPDDLFIEKISVDGGPMLKRFMPRAHGRATPVRERTSHVTLVLGELPKKSKDDKKEKKAKSKG